MGILGDRFACRAALCIALAIVCAPVNGSERSDPAPDGILEKSREDFRKAKVRVGETVTEAYRDYLKRNEGRVRYKVFVLSEDGVTAHWLVRREIKTAIDDAMRRCVRASRGRECRIFALGKRVLWGLQEREIQEAVAEYERERSTPSVVAERQALTVGALEGYEDYREKVNDFGFWVFAVAENGAWAYRHRTFLNAAIDDALISCQSYSKGSPCKLFAIGDVVVWGMAESEVERVKKGFEER